MIEATQIREHMEVVGSDDKHIGKVDHVMGADIQLSKAGMIGHHHLIPLAWVTFIDDKVHLNVTEDDAKSRWRELH